MKTKHRVLGDATNTPSTRSYIKVVVKIVDTVTQKIGV